MVRFIWFIIMVFSLAELFLLWRDWFVFVKDKNNRKASKVAGRYANLALKAALPGVLAIIGMLAVFLR